MLIPATPTEAINKIIMNDLKVGVIGVGNMGAAHATCLANGDIKGMTLTAICDINAEHLSRFFDKHPDVKAYSDFDALLESSGVDVIIVAVPHPLHADMAIKALKKGIHVLVEKPIDITVSKAKVLNETAKASGKCFGIMFNQRTNPLFKKAKQLVEHGELGQLKRTVWIVTNWYRTQCYYESGDWRATWSGEGGGVLLNQAPHNLDLWQWICGMPQSVTAYCDIAKYHNIEVEDDVTILTRYANGATGTFITTTGEYPGTNRLEISGTLGKIVLENEKLKWWRLKTDERIVCQTSQEGFATIETEYTEFGMDEPETGHKGILQNFADSILNGASLIAPGTDGIYELTLSNAAYLSSWKGNAEIALPFDCDEFDKHLSELVKTSTKHSAGEEQSESTGYRERWQVRW